MTLVRWNPWQDINTLQRQLDRLFDDVVIPTARTPFQPISRIPAAELSETEGDIHLRVEIPGLTAKDLEVEVTEKAVSIKGERKSEQTSEENGFTRSEFFYGTYERVISLPKRVENTAVKAEYKDGILSLTLPKKEAEKQKVHKVRFAEEGVEEPVAS
jgi:HSP20 family protein